MTDPDFERPGRALPTTPAAYDATIPPPWPLGPDPRTPDCRHDWTAAWGRPGERQRRCRHCRRYIWEREIWPQAGQKARAVPIATLAGPEPSDQDPSYRPGVTPDSPFVDEGDG